MPEGDTIHRAAHRLRPVLVGHQLTRFEAARATGPRPHLGEVITGVEAVGKHLLMHFSGGVSVRTHLRMIGSWHLYRADERWRKGAYLARVVVGADSGWVAVCFQAPIVETYRRAEGVPAPVAQLGPDLTTTTPDLDVAVARARAVADPTEAIANVLLDQRVACGIGNVYKSEVLFLHGVDPFTPVGALSADALRALFETASRLLVANLTTSRRVTYRGGVAVYGRARQPCPRCATSVRVARQGPLARTTYWCPQCQPRQESGCGPTTS